MIEVLEVSEAPTADDRIGQVVGRKYVLLRVLGRGGMGAVYLGRHAYTGREVAVKIVDPLVATSRAGQARFLQEARAASAIRHPSIVELLDAGQEEGGGALYLVFELLGGMDLDHRLARAPLTPDEVADVAIQVLEGLEAAHALGFVHRDVKPANLFLVAEAPPRVKLLDFGIVKRIGDAPDLHLTATGAVLGTPSYMSPEQAAGGKLDARTDLWSLGAVMFRALGGRPPFESENYNQLILRLATERPVSIAAVRPDLPADLVLIVDRALTPEPAARWSSAAEMRRALETYRGRLSPAPPDAGPPLEPRSGLAVRAAAAAIAIVALTAAAWWSLAGSPVPPASSPAPSAAIAPVAPEAREPREASVTAERPEAIAPRPEPEPAREAPAAAPRRPAAQRARNGEARKGTEAEPPPATTEVAAPARAGPSRRPYDPVRSYEIGEPSPVSRP